MKRWLTTVCICLLVSCTAHSAALPAPADVLPDTDAVLGWQQDGEPATYVREDLALWASGDADLYRAYRFEGAAVGRYTREEGSVVEIEVCRLATDADAYALFIYGSYGEPIDLGVDGSLETGHRLAFWQARTYVQIVAQSPVEDDALMAFGEAVGSALPEGGERPALVEALPTRGMRPGSLRFFRERAIIASLAQVGSDALGLGKDVEGVLAHYQIDGQRFDLVLIVFPDATRAQAARARLNEAGLEDLVMADAKGRTLGAVFGQIDEETATDSGCSCSEDEILSTFGRLPEELAQELLDEAMAPLP